MTARKKQKKKKYLFDRIAGYYGLFYQYQKRKYGSLLDKIYDELDLKHYRDAADIGCGTGALCSELHRRGFRVTGLDASMKMLEVAADKLKDETVTLVRSDFLEGSPFEDKSFDVSFASFVAHGLRTEERKKLYREMQRITRRMILIYDYNERRAATTDIIEWLEGGDYFNFIKNVRDELREYFHDLSVIDLGDRASVYVIRL